MSLPCSREWLLGFALIAGALLAIVGNLATDLVLGRVPFADGYFGSIDAPDVAVLHLLFTSLPMIVLALVGSRRLLLWSIAILLEACLWAYFVHQIWLHSLTGFAGGADMGLGLIMLCSPIFVLSVVGLLALFPHGKT